LLIALSEELKLLLYIPVSSTFTAHRHTVLATMYVIVFVSSQAVGSTVVVIGWAVWQLFDQCFNQWQSSGLANVVLILKAGPGYKPPIVPASAWNSCYRVCACVCVCAYVCVYSG